MTGVQTCALPIYEIDTNTALHIIRGVLNGVGALHAAPNFLLHRDLKPANILIDKTMSPIIADFGSIKRLPENSTEVAASQHSSLYQPPESYECRKYYITSDIYQIGILFYQLLGGYLPYNSQCYMTKAQLKEYLSITDPCEQSLFEDKCLYEKAKKEKLLDYSTLPDYIDKKIIQIIKRATKANPKERFDNIADFQLALHRVGSLPNWSKHNGMLLCENLNKSYRIAKNNKNQFLIEKENASNRWSKLRNSSKFSNESLAINYLLKCF